MCAKVTAKHFYKFSQVQCFLKLVRTDRGMAFRRCHASGINCFQQPSMLQPGPIFLKKIFSENIVSFSSSLDVKLYSERDRFFTDISYTKKNH